MRDLVYMRACAQRRVRKCKLAGAGAFRLGGSCIFARFSAFSCRAVHMCCIDGPATRQRHSSAGFRLHQTSLRPSDHPSMSGSAWWNWQQAWGEAQQQRWSWGQPWPQHTGWATQSPGRAGPQPQEGLAAGDEQWGSSQWGQEPSSGGSRRQQHSPLQQRAQKKGYRSQEPVLMPSVYGRDMRPQQPPGEHLMLLWPVDMTESFRRPVPGPVPAEQQEGTFQWLQQEAEAIGVFIHLRGRRQGRLRSGRPTRLTLLGPPHCTRIIAVEAIETAPALPHWHVRLLQLDTASVL